MLVFGTFKKRWFTPNLGCACLMLGKSKKCSLKLWFDSDLPWYRAKNHLKQIQEIWRGKLSNRNKKWWDMFFNVVPLFLHLVFSSKKRGAPNEEPSNNLWQGVCFLLLKKLPWFVIQLQNFDIHNIANKHGKHQNTFHVQRHVLCSIPCYPQKCLSRFSIAMFLCGHIIHILCIYIYMYLRDL